MHFDINSISSEILDSLNLKFKIEQGQITIFEEIFGGADTRIFSFDYHGKEILPLVVRVFRGSSFNTAKREFDIINELSRFQVNVPNVFILSPEESDIIYYVMDRIKGMTLTKRIQAVDNPLALLKDFYSQLNYIHDIKWREDLGHIFQPKQYSINIISDKYLQSIFGRIEKYQIKEFFPLIKWLENNMPQTEELVLIHGDYHPGNVLVTSEDKLMVIDWSNATIHDYRMDLGFSIGIISAVLGNEMEHKLLELYEELTGKKALNFEFYLIQAHLFNLLRMYSVAFDYSITGESDLTRKLFLNEYLSYATYLITKIEEITKIDLGKFKTKIMEA